MLDAIVVLGSRIAAGSRPGAAARRRVERATWALLVAAAIGCKETKRDVPASASASAAPAVDRRPDPGGPRRVPELLAAEHRRDARVVTDEDLGSRDVRVRRTAARALARIADARSAELLGRLLADEDEEVTSWAAYGLGYACKTREPATVRALAARAATLTARSAERGGQLDPMVAIADALSRCGTGEAERTLRAWLETSSAGEAGLALGKLASRHGRLDDASIVGLLDAASRPKQPLDTALFAFTRFGPLGDSVQRRLLEVAREALTRRGTPRRFAVRALGRAGAGGAKELGRVLASGDFSSAERADAARELARLGDAGQAALAGALPELASVAREPGKLASSSFGPLAALLDSLTVDGAKPASAVLGELAELPVPERSSATVRRRLVRVRCRAASLLAGRASLAPRLVACDPDPRGRIGALAMLSVLDRGPLTGARYRAWSELAEASDRVVRQAALALMPAHSEIRNPHLMLGKALQAAEPGTVAAAAEVLSAYPDRAAAETAGRKAPEMPADAGRPAPKPQPDLIKALGAAFDKADERKIETRAGLIDAAGALQLLSFLPRIEQDCQSSYPTLRQHAEKALGLLGARQPRCDTFSPPRESPRELASLVTHPVRLRFETDAGALSMTLDPAFAPIAVTRLVTLARSGFYTGITVHRVVPGFVVQLGDPGGDGYGGADAPPLRCETSPLSFAEGQVGIALAGRDTGSSQLFVTLGPYPHLDGDYAWIGHAEPGWDALAQGDVVHKVTAE